MPLHLVLGAQNGCRLPSIADGVLAAPHQVTVLAGVGHFPHWEAADPVTKIVTGVEVALAITSVPSDITLA
jgi:hypothetical protein